MAREIYVEKNDCSGCGNCTNILPHVFTVDSDMLSEVVPGSWDGVSEEDIQGAMNECAGGCIQYR